MIGELPSPFLFVWFACFPDGSESKIAYEGISFDNQTAYIPLLSSHETVALSQKEMAEAGAERIGGTAKLVRFVREDMGLKH